MYANSLQLRASHQQTHIDAQLPTGAGEPRLSAEDVGDRVATWLLSSEKLRRAKRSVREEITIGRAMSQLQSLAITQEVYGVVADYITPTHTEHCHLIVGASTP